MKISTKQEGWLAVVAVLIMVAVWPSSATVAILVGIAALLLFALHEFSKGHRNGEPVNPLEAHNEARQQEKARNRQKLMQHLESHDTLTNDEVQHLLNVADSTATTYLDELEEEGLLKQVGDTGSGVHYRKNG